MRNDFLSCIDARTWIVFDRPINTSINVWRLFQSLNWTSFSTIDCNEVFFHMQTVVLEGMGNYVVVNLNIRSKRYKAECAKSKQIRILVFTNNLPSSLARWCVHPEPRKGIHPSSRYWWRINQIATWFQFPDLSRRGNCPSWWRVYSSKPEIDLTFNPGTINLT